MKADGEIAQVVSGFVLATLSIFHGIASSTVRPIWASGSVTTAVSPRHQQL